MVLINGDFASSGTLSYEVSGSADVAFSFNLGLDIVKDFFLRKIYKGDNIIAQRPGSSGILMRIFKLNNVDINSLVDITTITSPENYVFTKDYKLVICVANGSRFSNGGNYPNINSAKIVFRQGFYGANTPNAIMAAENVKVGDTFKAKMFTHAGGAAKTTIIGFTR